LENPVKGAAVAVGLLVFGWALVAAADARHELSGPQVVSETFVQVVEVEREWVTPFADSLVDWAEVDRQSDCLYDWLLSEVGYGMSLEQVWAGGYWTDALGGACSLMEGAEQ